MGAPVTILAVCNAVATTIGGRITGLAATSIQSMGGPAAGVEAITEDYPDFPLMQVYWEEDAVDPTSVNNDRRTFKKGVSVSERTIYIDLIARARSQLPEDMKAVATYAELLIAALDDENAQPFFGVAGCKGLAYRVQRVTFQRGGDMAGGGGPVQHVGARAIVTVRIF